MPEQYIIEELGSGMTAIIQPMPGADSTATTLAVPCGGLYDPEGMEGVASLASEWMMRGAGDMDSRQLNNALDAMGSQYNLSTGHRFMTFSSQQLQRNLHGVLELAATIFMNPGLPDDHFDQCRNLIKQDVEALEDDPGRKNVLILKEKFLPWPLGRQLNGTIESLGNMELAESKKHIFSCLVPDGAILSITGKINVDETLAFISDLFESWNGTKPVHPTLSDPSGGYVYIEKDSAQQHMAIANVAPLMSNPGMYYPARVFEAIMSHGMGSRLFTEIREKRGLAYSVSAGYTGVPEAAGILTTAGSRPEVAQETLSIIISELATDGSDITDDELLRAKVQIRSSLVMSGQSPASRSSALVSDWFQLGEVRRLDEIEKLIKDVERCNIVDYLEAFPLKDPVIVTTGPTDIKPEQMATDRER